MKKILRSIYAKILSFLSSYLSFSLGRKKVRGKYIFKDNKGLIFGIHLNSFFSYHLRPKFEKDFIFKNIKNKHEDIAILIQGPIQKQNKFALETIKIYKKIFPNILIILSSWENDDTKDFKKLNSKNFHIIKSKQPLTSGELNINYQIKSVVAGLKFLNRFRNIKYVLKTRTDCRIYNPNSFLYLKDMINNFPIKKNNFLEKRILFSSVATCKFRVYGATDIVQFGTLRDLTKYWKVPYYEDGLLNLVNKNKNPIIKGTPVISEIYLFAHFIYRNNIKLNWSLKHWWSLLRSYFLVFDSHTLDFFWNKYEKNIEMRFHTTYSETLARSLNFNDWLKIYHNNYKELLNTNHQEKWNYKNNKFIQINV